MEYFPGTIDVLNGLLDSTESAIKDHYNGKTGCLDFMKF